MKIKNNLLDELGKIVKKEGGDVPIKIFGITKKASTWIEYLKIFEEATNGNKSGTKRKAGKKRIQTVTRSKSRNSLGKNG